MASVATPVPSGGGREVPASDRQPGAGRLERAIGAVERNATWALAGLMLLSGALLLYMGRGLSFFYDDWNFVINDYGGRSPLAAARPRGQHLGLPRRRVQGPLSPGRSQPLRGLPLDGHRSPSDLRRAGLRARSAAHSACPRPAGSDPYPLPRRGLGRPAVGFSGRLHALDHRRVGGVGAARTRRPPQRDRGRWSV